MPHLTPPPSGSVYVYDIETLPNFFCVTFINLKDKSDQRIFVIAPWRNDFEPLLDFLFGDSITGNDLKLIGFNNLGFDYPVLHPFIVNAGRYTSMPGAKLAKLIYERAGEVLDEEFKRDYPAPLIPQLDLYRVWHFNNKARMTSLKYLQINMHWHDVREMPYSHSHQVKQGAEEQEIIDYNINDVLSTMEFYHLSKKKIRMRKTLSEKYGKDFRNSPDTRIGESIFLHVMSNITGISEKELSSRKTERPSVDLAEAIPEGVYFGSDVFNGILQRFKEMTITNTRNIEKDSKGLFSVMFDGMRYDFGFGGLHGVREAGIYHDLDSADVGGYYPSLSISKQIYPHHLGPVFPEAHKVIKAERSQYVKGTDESDALKLAGNGVFGTLNAPWSPFYDPLALLKTTIGGQLLLAQLCEQLTMANAGRIMMVNTDGFEIEVLNRQRYEKICAIWQKEHNLTLDFSKYKTLAIRDVNNYIGVKDDGKVKEKGAYVVEPEIHKNRSMQIVRHAVREYFVNGVPVEKTIGDSTDIKMFVMGKRAKTGNLEWREAKNLTELISKELPKNVRYFVSKSGGSIVKTLAATKAAKKKSVVGPNQLDLFTIKQKKKEKQTRDVSIHKGFRVTLFNKWVDKPFEEYNIDKSFYIKEAKKLIDPILKSQTKF